MENQTTCCGEELEEQIEISSDPEVKSDEQLELEFLADKELNSQQRFDICKSCPSLNSLNLCKECGCFMNIKVRIYKASCPLGNW